MASWLNGIVIEKTQWNERLFSLRIEVEFSDFLPGQFVRVALDIDDERVARPYSLVSSPSDNFIEIYFNIVPEGPLSPNLAALNEGDEIFVSDRANGFLTVEEIPECRHLWMMATGTGIGPFLSILKKDKVWQRFERVVLGYSVRDSSELAYHELIKRIQTQHAEQLVFTPFITRETVADAMKNRIPVCIEDGSLEARTGITINENDSHVMMCGNSAMITDVSSVLEKRGLRKHRRREPGHLTTEKYH
jgi:ferredoxin--NADP+ reductase